MAEHMPESLVLGQFLFCLLDLLGVGEWLALDEVFALFVAHLYVHSARCTTPTTPPRTLALLHIQGDDLEVGEAGGHTDRRYLAVERF